MQVPTIAPAADAAPRTVAGCPSLGRLPSWPDLIDEPLRGMIKAQEGLLLAVLTDVLRVAGAAMPDQINRPRVCPPGWWCSAEILGDCSIFGRVVMVFAGSDGLPLDHVVGPDTFVCIRGLNPRAWATIALHESVHAAHWASLGLGKAAALATDPDRPPGAEPEGFGSYIRDFHRRWTGRPLPTDYDALRWPQDAPGMQVAIAQIAAAVTPCAIPPGPGRKPTDAEWFLAFQREAWFWLRDDDQKRALAAAWRAAA